jgi:hypothetical protein
MDEMNEYSCSTRRTYGLSRIRRLGTGITCPEKTPAFPSLSSGGYAGQGIAAGCVH